MEAATKHGVLSTSKSRGTCPPVSTHWSTPMAKTADHTGHHSTGRWSGYCKHEQREKLSGNQMLCVTETLNVIYPIFIAREQLCWRDISCRNSVCLSVCHTRALWRNQTMHCGYFDTTRKGNHSCSLTPTVVGGWRHLSSEICAQIDPPPSKNADFDRLPLVTSQR